MQLAKVSLDDKYQIIDGALYLTGTQALVKLAMLQGVRDRAAGRGLAGPRRVQAQSPHSCS